MKKLLSITLALAGLTAFIAPPSVHASASKAPVVCPGAPGTTPCYTAEGLDRTGVNAYLMEASTPVNVAVLLFSGTGIAYEASCSSGTLGDFMVLFDSASTNGITAETYGKRVGLAISPGLITTAPLATASSALNWEPRSARYLTNGLVGYKRSGNVSGGTPNCIVHAVKDDGANPPD